MLIKMVLMFVEERTRNVRKHINTYIHVQLQYIESEVKINTIIIIMELKTYCTHKSQVRKRRIHINYAD